MGEMQEVTVYLPTPYPLQREILEHPARRKVIVAGRRAGKTTLAALAGVEHFLFERGKVLIASTTQEQSDMFWDKAKMWLRPAIQAGAVLKSETRRTLDRLNEGQVVARLRVKTGSNPDVLRGDDADLIIFDECAWLDPAAWYAVAAPMLADRDGRAIFVGTPHRKNWFFHLHHTAGDPANSLWEAWHFSTHANPWLSATAVDQLAIDMTERTYRQEILAEFLEGEGAVFRKIREAAALIPRQPYPGRFVCGLDWARVNDFTAMVVMDMDTRKVVALDRFTGVDWSLQRGCLRALVDAWRPQAIIAEANSVGGPNIEALQREGLPVIPFTMTAQSKPPLIESLALAFERHEIQIIDDPVLVGELEAYEQIVNRYTGRISFGAPEGLHDDTVIALALAWYGVVGQRQTALQVASNPFYS